jgi:hypothetical protein
LLDKQRNELNEHFAVLEARFSALDARSAHPEGVEVAPEENPNSDKAKVDIPPKLDGPSLHAKPYEYPLEHVPMPHMNPSSGAPPMLDEFNYSYWKSCMRSHLRCVCVELWGVVENGFTPIDEKHLTPKERIDFQLNSTALDKIRQSLKREVYDQVSSIESAKELWEKLSVNFDGTSAMQKTKYEAAKQDMNLFCMNDGESVTSAYSRLQALKEKIFLLGGNTIDDGFHMNDSFVKKKFIEIVSTEYKELAFHVTFLEPCRKMTADELVGYFVAHDDMIAKATRTKEIVCAMTKNPSLAFKACHSFKGT